MERRRLRLFILACLVLTAALAVPCAAAWPSQSQWIPAMDANWALITDAASDVNPRGQLDCVIDRSSPTPSASFWFYDGSNMYFRLVVDGDPVRRDKAGAPLEMNPFGWNVMIESTGDNFADWCICLDGTGSSALLHSLYNIGSDNAMDGPTGWSELATQVPYQSGGFDYLVNGMVRISQVTATPSLWHNSDPDYYIDLQAPLHWLSRQGYSIPAPVGPTTPIKAAFGTGASGQTINKDLVGQTGTFDMSSFYTTVPPVSAESALSGGYGTLVDARHAYTPASMGIWLRGEALVVNGYGWPRSGSPYYTGSLSVRIVDPSDAAVWHGTVPLSNSGTIENAATWQIGQAAAIGVYGIYVADPRQPSTYILKDTFTVCAYDLSTSSKSVSSTIASTGDELVYAITVNNTGNIAVSNAVLFDSPPDMTTYVPGSTTLNGASVADVAGDSQLARGLALGTLEPFSTATVTFKASIDTGTPDQYVIENTAQLTWNGGGLERSAVTSVNAPAITVVKSVDLPLAMPGDELTYTTACTNTGHAVATSLELIDPIPEGTEYLLGSSTGSPGVQISFRHIIGEPYDMNEQSPTVGLKWLIGALDPGQSVTLSFRVIVK